MSFYNFLTIPEYWVQIGTDDVYRITKVDRRWYPTKYRLRICKPKCHSDETSFYELTEEQIRQRFEECNSLYKELEVEYEKVFKNSYDLTVCNIKPKISDLKLEVADASNGLVQLWFSSEQKDGLFYYHFYYDNYQDSYKVLEVRCIDNLLSFMVVPTPEVYDYDMYYNH